ncbi:amidohydrolase [Rhodobacterales bacterium 52_120_T64]|nr:amidohydrolase [Rhodobacterales bacterium 52_120_T64]
MKVALVQFTSSNDPAANLLLAEGFIREAHAGGAEFILTPETTNIISSSRKQQAEVLHFEAEDPSLARLRDLSQELKIWLLIGSLGLKTGDADARFANRSFLISPTGEIAARYDKIHMFDVDLGNGEVYRESSAYRPGTKATLAKTDIGNIGMTICYDLRFPDLYRELAQAGADILTAPAAFTVPTGRAHWHALLRARAIENGCFVLAPAQCGMHDWGKEPRRETFGHSLVISPWGEVLADGGETQGVTFVELDLNDVAKARAKIPSLMHDREFEPPEA